MIGTFPGKLALMEGDEVDVDLEISGGRLRLTTGVSEIGSWPLESCALNALPDGSYELLVDDEHVSFHPDHPEAFAAVVAKMAPVEDSRFDLEAALDQVLGGPAVDYEVPGLDGGSADEIAVTLEALFATAFPEYDPETEEATEDADPAEEVVEEDEAPEAWADPVGEAPEEMEAERPKPTFEAETIEVGDSTDEFSGTAPEADDTVIGGESGWNTESPEDEWSHYDVPAWTPQEETEDDDGEEVADSVVDDGWGAALPEDINSGSSHISSVADQTDHRVESDSRWNPAPDSWAPDSVQHVSPAASHELPASYEPAASYESPGDPTDGPLRESRGFDLDAAVAHAGYDEDGELDPVYDEPDRVERPSGMFSKTASERFAAVAGARRDAAGDTDEAEDDDLSVADQIRATQEQLRSASSVRRFDADTMKKVGIGAVILTIVGALVALTPAVIRSLADQVEETAPSTTPTTVSVPETTVAATVTTVVPSSTVAAATSVFELSSGSFVERWDGVAQEVSGSLLIDRPLPAGSFGLGFTQFIGLEGVVDTDATLESYTVVVDPRGEPADDQLGIQALGLAINVAEPDLTGADLRDVLADLGLDVSNPLLEGLDGIVVRGAIEYHLRFESAGSLIKLTVGPPGTAKPPEPPEEEPEP